MLSYEQSVQVLQLLYPREPQMQTLAFGILGGLDIGQQSHLLRSKPLKLILHTERTSWEHFSNYTQIQHQCIDLTEDWDAQWIAKLLVTAPNVFLVGSTDVWSVQVASKASSDNTNLWIARNVRGDTWTDADFSSVFSTIDLHNGQILIIGDIKDISLEEILKLALSEHCAYFSNSAGVESKVQNWLNHIRRPSLRKSWPILLSERKKYFWMAVQMFSQIYQSQDVAHREKYIQFLRHASEKIAIPELREIAVLFHSSMELWQLLGACLLDDESAVLQGIAKNSSEILQRETDSLLREFLLEKQPIDVDARLQLLADSVERILYCEQQAFRDISVVLQQKSYA